MKNLLKFILFALVVSTVIHFAAEKTDIFSDVPKDIPVYNEDGFFYSGLSENEKKSYNLIMNSIYDFPEEIVVTELSDAELDRVFEAVLYDNTDLFFLDDSCTLSADSFNYYFKPEYIITKDEYEQKMQELEEVEDEIVQKAMQLESDYDKEFFIHQEVVLRCEYVEKNDGDYSSAYGCLVNGQSSCQGYAMSMKRLLDKCNIDNYFAMGETEIDGGEIAGHIWNIVKIDGDYYHLDATWDDTENSDTLGYTYFNLTDEEISITHDVETKFLGKCNSTSQNYFVKNGLYFTEYDEYFENEISQKIADFADEDSPILSFKFDDKETYEEAFYDLIDNENTYRLLTRADMVSEKYIITGKVLYMSDEEHFVIEIVDYYE